MEYAYQAAKIVTFFVINMLVYELIVFGAGALIVIPFCCSSKMPEEVVDGIVKHTMRICIAVVVILLILWIIGTYRMIPIPG